MDDSLRRRQMSGVGGRRLAPLADVDFIQLSKIRSAANGKEETSRVRMGVLRGVSAASGTFRTKREPLNPLYRKEKKGFGGLMLCLHEDGKQVMTGFL